MKSLYNDEKASEFKTDLDLRVYTSRLLGQEPSLVLHGGGNTSVKSSVKNLFGEIEDILYVKGSGWDLATIEAGGFAPVKMRDLLKMAELDNLSDMDMVKYQRVAMINPSAPNPSVEAILHAVIPFKYVDHTHADAIITITNTDGGKEKIEQIYGSKVLIIPYIMPGFDLAKLVYEMTKNIDWHSLEGMVLMNHGLFTFGNSAKESYEKTIELVKKAQNYLESSGAVLDIAHSIVDIDIKKLAKIRQYVSRLKGHATISVLNESKEALFFSKQEVETIANRGPLTPDHVIRTKRVPAIVADDFKKDLDSYVQEYKNYFKENKKDETMLNPAPNFAILKGEGSLSFGKDVKEALIIKDINNHTFEAILKAELLGGYRALSSADIFAVEYWSLEQAKLKNSSNTAELGGKIAIVTNAMSKIGSAIAKMLHQRGAAVIALDNDKEVKSIFCKQDTVGMECDFTNRENIEYCLAKSVKSFGGIDIVIDCTGSKNSGYQEIFLEGALELLEVGIDPLVLFIAPKANEFNFKKQGIRVASICYEENLDNMQEQIAQMACLISKSSFAKLAAVEIVI